MDFAEHFYGNCSRLFLPGTDSLVAENLSDVLYEIGKSNLQKREFDNALVWLQRAYDAIGEQDVDSLSSDASELRLSIMHGIGKGIEVRSELHLH